MWGSSFFFKHFRELLFVGLFVCSLFFFPFLLLGFAQTQLSKRIQVECEKKKREGVAGRQKRYALVQFIVLGESRRKSETWCCLLPFLGHHQHWKRNKTKPERKKEGKKHHQ